MSDLNDIHTKPRRRRIMRKLKITELSCVDRPAQAGAVATIMKREDTARPNYADIWCREQDALEKAAEMPFEDTVIEIQKRDDCDRTAAMTRARLEHPDAWAAYSGREVPVAKGKGGDKAKWDMEVAGEQARTGCSAAEAARRVRRSKPDLAIGKAITEPPERFQDEMAKTKWLRTVAEIQSRDRCSNTAAMIRNSSRKPRPLGSLSARRRQIGYELGTCRPLPARATRCSFTAGATRVLGLPSGLSDTCTLVPNF